MSKNPIITVLVASAILLFRPSPVMSQSQISDFIFPPGKNMFAERKLTDPSLDSSRIGEVVVIPYLIHVDHTTRKLEVVCYALDKPTVQVEVRSVQMGPRTRTETQIMTFAKHPKQPCLWSRYTVWDSLQDEFIFQHITNQGINVFIEVAVGSNKKKLSFRLQQRIRSYPAK